MNNDVKDILEKAYKQGHLDGFDFAIFMQNLLISDHGYVIDTGNWEKCECRSCCSFSRTNKETSDSLEAFLYGCVIRNKFYSSNERMMNYYKTF